MPAEMSAEMPMDLGPVEDAAPAPVPDLTEDVFSEAIAAAMTMPENDVRELPDDIELLDGTGSASDAFVSNALSGAPAEPVEPEPQIFVNHHQEEKKMEQQVVQQLSAPTDENAVITAGMRIDGDVTTSGSLDVIGKINGNVTANGKLSVTGSLEGNLNAAEIYAENARITGEVRSQGAAKIGQSTVIIGNIFATSAVIAGAVKGDIDVHGPVVLDTTAIVMGNIKSQSVQINNDAVVEGMCSQSYAEVNPQAFFDGLDD
ncbi:MAG: polymer-forming cytoskeletal protein [Lachnospiraceae bacterium]|nr:polymer-forming cytoskeletal protein [Lachnospiraceae bacterium]